MVVNRTAQRLFAPLAPRYERWARILSLGQDPRWRRLMLSRLGLAPGSRVLDVAAGTGSITRGIEDAGAAPVAVDQSEEMLRAAWARGATCVVAAAEALPFPDETFDAVTFGYLIRYAHDVEGCVAELTRVLKPGGRMGMVEFGRPEGVWRPLWWIYTRLALPVAGLLAGRGWFRVGRFLGPSIDGFADHYPPHMLIEIWRSAGMGDVELARPSLGGGLVMWGAKGE